MSLPDPPAVSSRAVNSLVTVLRAALGCSPEVPLGHSAGRIDTLVRRLRPADRRALGLGLVALNALAWVRFGRSLSRLPIPAVERLLLACHRSRIPPLRRLSGVAIRLVLFAHFDGPETWASVGYDGPWLGRIPVEPGPAWDLPVERIAS